MKPLFPLFLLTIILAGCTPKFTSRLDLNRDYRWEKEQISLNPSRISIVSTGEIELDGHQGNHNGTFELYHVAPEKWRIAIRGPFNIEIVSVIVNDSGVFVLHDGHWEPVSWRDLSGSVFGIQIPLRVFKPVFGAALTIDGKCTAISEKEKVCRDDEIFYLFVNGKLLEMKNESLDIIKNGDYWQAKGRNNTVTIEVEKVSQLSVDESVFKTVRERDIFDEM